MDELYNNLKDAFSSPLNITFSIFDIILTIVLVYYVAIFFKKCNASRLIKYVAILLTVAVVLSSELVPTYVGRAVGGKLILILAFLTIILFSQEIKRGMWKLASPKNSQSSYTTKYDCSDEELHEAVSEIVRAVQNMSKKDVGALIIIAPDDIPESILESGTSLNSELSCQLLECIFNTKAPLHDGAVYIHGNKVLSAGCFLPLTQQTNIDKELGTRHRAAIGETEQYKHLAIIVSEETGIISVARGGEIERYYDSQMLTDVLEQIYGLKAVGKEQKHGLFGSHGKKKSE